MSQADRPDVRVQRVPHVDVDPWPSGEDADVVILGAPGLPGEDAFAAHALDLIAADPRVASVSWADPVIETLAGIDEPLRTPARDPQPGWAPATRPAGWLIAINTTVTDLTGPPCGRGGRVTAETLEAWARRGNERGLRHLWWTSGHIGAGPVPTWPAGPLDVHESTEPLSPLNLLVERHRATHAPLRLGVEAAWLREHETGAQVATVQWVAALAQRDDIAEIVLYNLPGDRLPWYAEHLRSHRARVTIADERIPVPDVFWRPYQPDESTALSRDRRLGRRLVTTVLDLIEFTNERYQGTAEAWYRRRRQFRSYARQVDVLTGISDDVVRHLAVEVPCLERDRLFTTALGVEHLTGTQIAAAPHGLESLAGPERRPFLLVLGNDFLHKNRDLAIRIWQEVARDVPVDLVLAGLHVGASSTGDLEREILADLGPVQGRVRVFQHVSGEEKAWLLANAAVLLYPTSAEGFGFVPHEAAALGTPSAYTSFGPLAEFLPDGVGSGTWRVAEYAEEVRTLLTEAEARERATAEISQAGRALTWQAAGDSLVHAFRQALSMPPQPWGLWERTEVAGAAGPDHSMPVPPSDLTASMGRAADARGWRTKAAVRRARRLAGKVRRRLRARAAG